MKIMAFNSSPNMAQGNTATLLQAFLKGMKQGGAQAETFYTPISCGRSIVGKTVVSCYKSYNYTVLMYNMYIPI